MVTVVILIPKDEWLEISKERQMNITKKLRAKGIELTVK